MKLFWDRILNISLVITLFVFSYAWNIIFYVIIVFFIIFQISQIQWEHNLLLEGNFLL